MNYDTVTQDLITSEIPLPLPQACSSASEVERDSSTDATRLELLRSRLEEVAAMLRPTALPGYWINSRNQGGKTYYRLRWMQGTDRREVSIKAEEVAVYQRRIDDGRFLKNLSQIMDSLRERLDQNIIQKVEQGEE